VQSVVFPIKSTGNVVMLWDSCPPSNYEAELLPFEDSSSYSSYGTDSQANRVPCLGDLVVVNSATGMLRRYHITGTSAGTHSLMLPFGVVIGTAMNPIGYPAFAGEYYNNLTERPHVLVANLGVGSELFVYRIRTSSLSGRYVNPDESISGENPIRVGDPVRFSYQTATGRWGVIKAVPPAGGSVHVHGEVIGLVSRPKVVAFDGFTPLDNLIGLHIRLVQPYVLSG